MRTRRRRRWNVPDAHETCWRRRAVCARGRWVRGCAFRADVFLAGPPDAGRPPAAGRTGRVVFAPLVFVPPDRASTDRAPTTDRGDFDVRGGRGRARRPDCVVVGLMASR